MIATGHAGVWGINRSGTVYYREGTHRNPGHMGSKWVKVEEDKKMKSLSVGNEQTYRSTDIWLGILK